MGRYWPRCIFVDLDDFKTFLKENRGFQFPLVCCLCRMQTVLTMVYNTITAFSDFVQRRVFWKLENNISETGSVSVFRLMGETPNQWLRLSLSNGTE
jgi:hypothetical protein